MLCGVLGALVVLVRWVRRPVLGGWVYKRQVVGEACQLECSLHRGRAGEDRELAPIGGRCRAHLHDEAQPGRVEKRGAAQVQDQAGGAGAGELLELRSKLLDGGEVEVANRAYAYGLAFLLDFDTEVSGD